MMKQQLKEFRMPSSSIQEGTVQHDHPEVRREELYLPKATHGEVSKSFEHGFINPASGGLKS
eukprot:5961589-Prorocentrum_lima.AAC.1